MCRPYAEYVFIKYLAGKFKRLSELEIETGTLDLIDGEHFNYQRDALQPVEPLY